jgi:hypothetical protein
VSGDDQFVPNLVGDEAHVRSETEQHVANGRFSRDVVVSGRQRNDKDFAVGTTDVDSKIIGRAIEWAKAVQQTSL